MLTLVVSALLIFSIYTLAVLSFFPRESYEKLKAKLKDSSEGRLMYRNFFSRMYLISSVIALVLTIAVIYFFIF